MAAVHDVLVVGAGMAGVGLGILLVEAGVNVRVVDTKDGVHALGSGITLQGNALRVLRDLGVWEEVAAHGYAFDDLGLRPPTPTAASSRSSPSCAPAAPTCPPPWASPAPTSRGSPSTGPWRPVSASTTGWASRVFRPPRTA